MVNSILELGTLPVGKNRSRGCCVLIRKFKTADLVGNVRPPVLFGPADKCMEKMVLTEHHKDYSGIITFNTCFVILEKEESALHVLTEYGESGWIPSTDAIGGKWWEYLST